MHGNNILGEKKKETIARFYSEVWDCGFGDDGKDLPEGLAADRRCGAKTSEDSRTACGMWERKEKERTAQLARRRRQRVAGNVSYIERTSNR
jgi:hypothetical protein